MANQKRHGNSTHGHTPVGNHSKTYRAWRAAKVRCYLTSCKEYRYYGERGITMCDRWLHSFESFLADMGECPPERSLDRIDNDGNYEPGNCRWATRSQQIRNSRQAHLIVWRNETRSLAEWVEMTGLNYDAVKRRLQNGWTPERALTTPIGAPSAERRQGALRMWQRRRQMAS